MFTTSVPGLVEALLSHAKKYRLLKKTCSTAAQDWLITNHPHVQPVLVNLQSNDREHALAVGRWWCRREPALSWTCCEERATGAYIDPNKVADPGSFCIILGLSGFFAFFCLLVRYQQQIDNSHTTTLQSCFKSLWQAYLRFKFWVRH